MFTIVVSTSETREDCAIAEISFDPINLLLLTREKLHKIPHRVLYLSPKHVTEATPEPYREWLKLIQDSLDEQVDESSYQKTEVLKVVNLIKTDGLTPQDRARMKDEYAQEEALGKEREEKFLAGLAQGLEKGLEKGREQGLEEGLEKGREESKVAIAKNLLAQGVAVELDRTGDGHS